MPPGRIVVVCPVLPFPPVDGGRKRTLRLLEAAARTGLEPHLLTPDGGEEGACDALRDRGWTVEVLPRPAPSLRGRLRQQARRLPSPVIPAVDARLRELVRGPGTLVQIEHTQSAYYSRALRGVPWVLSLHNVDSELMLSIARTRRPGTLAWLRAWNQWQATRMVERREVRRAPAVLCVSERDRALLDRGGAEIVVAPNGVDDEFFAVPVARATEPRVVFFGRLDYPPNEHGISKFLRQGWPAIAVVHPDARLRIVGGGASTELRRLAAATPSVEFVGFVEDLVAELEAAWMTLVPLWAGSGTRLKVLESLAAGRPVVGTSLGVEGLGFESGAHGLVADSSAELAECVSELLADPARARDLGVGGRELAEAFRWTRTMRPAMELYRRLAEAAV